jgi:hypothetical protein
VEELEAYQEPAASFADRLARATLPAYVIIDPKGEMVKRLSHLDIFFPNAGYYRDRLVVIDPTQTPLPALDLFHQPQINASAADRVRIRNHLIDTFVYIFSSSNAQLTQRQSIPFAYLVRLVFSMGGNLDTFMDILEDNAKDKRFYSYMQKLGEEDRGARRFFENDFYSAGFNDTRQQIKTRLYEIISKPELMDMFAAGQNKLSLFDCIQQRKIVLINTAMPQLGATTSQLLGRYFIAATLNSAFARFSIPKSQWTPAYLIIDEYQDFCDEEMTSKMLRLAREYNLGIVIAHQNMHCPEMTENIRASISTNTSIKYAASPEGLDLGYMARDMRCEPDFLKGMTKQGTTAKFACYVRGMNLQHPFVYDVDLGLIDLWPKMPDDAHEYLMEQQREALKAQVQQKPQVCLHPQPNVTQPMQLPPQQNIEQPRAQQPTKPRREPDTQTQIPTKSAPSDPHTGDHSEPASKWGDQ